MFRRHAASPDVIVRANRARGPFDPAAFARAFGAVVERHEALRTTFREADGRVLARVERPEPVPLEVEDATGWSEERVEAWLVEACARPFDLSRVPLLRLHVLVRGPEDHVVLLAAHHIGCDAWSVYVILAEIAFLYPAFEVGPMIELPHPGRQYRDHARALAARLEAEGPRLAAWWRAALEGTPRPVERAEGLGACGGIALRIDGRLTVPLRAAARAAGTTVFGALATALAGAIAAESGSEDVVIGTTTAGRRRDSDTAVVGAFFNTIPLVCRASPARPLEERLRATGQTVREALARQELPFQRIETAAGGGPLFRTLLVLHKAGMAPVPGLPAFAAGVPGGTIQLGRATFEPVQLPSRRVGYDLYLPLAELGDDLVGTLWHRLDAYDDAAARALAGRFRAELETLERGGDA
jgi:hypothetical protein